MIRPLIAGFVIKIAAGFDDMFSRVPVMVALTRTRIGKVAFALGNLFAVILVIAVVRHIAPLMGGIENYRTFVGVAILIIAAAVYFEVFSGFAIRRQEGAVKRFSTRFSTERFLTLVVVGFIVSLFTLVDDAVVYMPLFVQQEGSSSWFAAAGILVATFIQLMVLVYAAERLAKVRHQKVFSAVALVVYAVLVLTGVV